MKNKLKNIFKTQKHIFIFITGIVVFGSVATNQLYLSKRTEKVESNSKQASPTKKEEDLGEVEGVQLELNPEVSPPPQLVEKKETIPTIEPQVKSNNTGQENNSSNQNSNNNTSNTHTVVVVTASPAPTSTPVPTNTPTIIPPTPSPDTSPFVASMATGGGNAEEVTANKPLQSCQFVEATSGGGLTVSGNGNISGNICTLVRGNPTYTYFSMKITSIYGEEEILGNPPANYW